MLCQNAILRKFRKNSQRILSPLFQPIISKYFLSRAVTTHCTLVQKTASCRHCTWPWEAFISCGRQTAASFTVFETTDNIRNYYVRTRKRRQRFGKGWSKETQEGSSWQHPGYYKACYSQIGTSRWCQANLWIDLRRDAWCSQGLPRERHPWRCDVHRACQAKDSDCHGCRLRSQAPGTYSVRIWRLSIFFAL